MSIKNIFDKNPDTICIFQSEYGSQLELHFSKPVYIKRISIISNRSNNVSRNIPEKNVAKHIIVTGYKDENEFWTGESKSIYLGGGSKKTTVDFNQTYLSLLRTQALNIKIDAKKENWSNPILIINELDIDYADDTYFKPVLSFDLIKGKYLDKSGIIHFKDNLSHSKKNDIIKHLIYYALKGNSLAEDCLLKYNPKQADESEWYDYLISWYEQTRNTKL